MDKKKQITSLASLAVFRELYNSQTDVYGVIGKFINEIISSQGKYSFSLTEITNLLNEKFCFNLPEAVVSTSIGRIDNIVKEYELYTVEKNHTQNSSDVNALQQKSINNSNRIIEGLFNFISEETGSILNDKEKEVVVQSFCSFLMDSSNGKDYSEYISSYIIKNSINEIFKTDLAKIREGVILYSGLTHNPNLNEVGTWNSELTIYLDTEMLFHFAGYNGILFKSIFDDFYNYVVEINNKGKKRLIRLKYFTEARERIERFFTKAEYIVKGHDKPNPRTTAMVSVAEGCSDASDVNEKKTEFFELLKRNVITEESGPNVAERKNHEYNIIDSKTIESLSKEFEDDVTENIKILNYIGILRSNCNLNNFYNISYILLTGNSRTTTIAWHPSIKDEGNVPLATNLYWLTNKFWFKLNKGFGVNSFPKSLEITTKALTTLSSILNESIGNKFDELKIQFSKGEITEEQAKSRLVNLRSQSRNPENIKQDEIKSILSTISEDSLERFIREQEISKSHAIKKQQENLELKAELERKKAEIELKDKEKMKAEEQLKSTSNSSRNMLLDEKKKRMKMLEDQKQSFELTINHKLRIHKAVIATGVICYYLFTFFLIYKYSWETMEQYTYIINTVVPIIIFFLYSLIFENHINIVNYLPMKREKIKEQVYRQSKFDIKKIESLENEIIDLERKIKE